MAMMVGIVTEWFSTNNYGGLLQTFALQRYLRDCGSDAFVIRDMNQWSVKSRIKDFVMSLLAEAGVFRGKRADFDKQKRLNHKRDKLRNFGQFPSSQGGIRFLDFGPGDMKRIAYAAD